MMRLFFDLFIFCGFWSLNSYCGIFLSLSDNSLFDDIEKLYLLVSPKELI